MSLAVRRKISHNFGKVETGLFIATVLLILVSLPYLLSEIHSPVSGTGGGGPNELSTIVYDTFASLKGNSTIVVLASIANLNASFCDYPHQGCLARDFVFQLNPISFIKGSVPQAVYIWDNSMNGPVLTVGGEYVLFLGSIRPCAPSPPAAPCVLPPTPLSLTYTIVGGVQGKFLVKNDVVYGYKTLYPKYFDWVLLDANGVPLNDFISQVAKA